MSHVLAPNADVQKSWKEFRLSSTAEHALPACLKRQGKYILVAPEIPFRQTFAFSN